MSGAFKKCLSVILAVTLIFGSAYVGLNEAEFNRVFAVGAKAASISIEDITYELSADGTHYIVSDCDSSASGAAYIVSKINGVNITEIATLALNGCTGITSVKIPDTVTSIGERAFSGCTSLSSISIPDTVTNIGAYAFHDTAYYKDSDNWDDKVLYIGKHLISADKSISGKYSIKSGTLTIAGSAFFYCESLESVTFPDSVTTICSRAFYGCSGIVTVSLGSGLKNINDAAFSGCAAMDSITIPESVTFIGGGAFVDCLSLSAVYTPNITSWWSIDFTDSTANPLCYAGKLYENDVLVTEVTTPGGFSKVKKYTFFNCRSIEKIVIKSGITEIGEYAFASCSEVGSISLPSYTLKRIGRCAFKGCAQFTSIRIPDSVNYMGASAFEGCKSLVSFIISDNLKYINEYTFAFCDSLVSAEIMKGVEGIGYGAFYYCENLKSVVIPDSVTDIGNNAFYECVSLNSFTMGNGVENIGDGAFYNCTNLSNITFPDSVKTIGEDAFGRCENFTEITIGSGVETIKDGAFSYCTYLSTVKISENVTSIGENAFYNCNLSSVITPCNSYASTYFDASVLDLIHDHSTEWTIDLEPTCTEDGSKSRHCSRCDDKADVTVLEAIGHNYILDELSVHPHTKTYTCDNCGDVQVESPTVTDCIECNFTITQIDSSSYKLVSYIGSQTNLKIPATYNGKDVTTIANSCFRNNTEITRVEIEDGVTTIGAIAFMGCSSLQKVFIPESVTSIGANAFYNFPGAIYCYAGSEAHKYAEANGVKYVLLSILETEDTSVDYDNYIITTTIQGATDYTELFSLSEGAEVFITPSYSCGDLEFYGTGTVITLFNGANYVGDFTLVVEGDINGDSVCDALDAAQLALVSNGMETIDGAHALAADSNTDDVVDVNDYQAIINKVVA